MSGAGGGATPRGPACRHCGARWIGTVKTHKAGCPVPEFPDPFDAPDEPIATPRIATSTARAEPRSPEPEHAIRVHVEAGGTVVASIDVDGRTLRVCGAQTRDRAVTLLRGWLTLDAREAGR